MLDSGNSSAAVAQMLAVPVSVIQDWRGQPMPPRPEPEALLAALGAHGHAPSFGTTLAVNRSGPDHPWRRTLWNWLKGLATTGLFGLAYASWRNQHAFGDLYVDVLPLAACSLLWLDRNRPLLLLDGRAIVVPRWFGKATMPYADLADWWLVMHVLHEDTDQEVEGRLLTLHSRRPGLRPLSVFISDAVTLDPRVLERLELVKKTNQGAQPLTPIRHLPKD